MGTQLGNAGLIEQPGVRTYEPGKGWRTSPSWKGPIDLIEAKATDMALLGYTIEIRYGFTTAELIASISSTDGQGGVDDAVDTWEMLPNKVEKDIFQSELQIVTDCGETNCKKIQDFLKADTAGKVITTADFEGTTLSKAASLSLYNQMVVGMKSVEVSAPVLRHTKTVSPLYTTGTEMNNLGKVLSSAYLLANEGVPDMLVPVSNFPTTTNKYAMKYGWLKAFPTVTISAGNRRQVVREWSFGLWSQLIYTHVA